MALSHTAYPFSKLCQHNLPTPNYYTINAHDIVSIMLHGCKHVNLAPLACNPPKSINNYIFIVYVDIIIMHADQVAIILITYNNGTAITQS